MSNSQILKSLSGEIADLIEKVSPSVVGVIAGSSRGSGVVWSQDGYIVTCNHVVGRHNILEVKQEEVGVLKAKVVGRDSYSDLAVLKTKGVDLTLIERHNSEDLKVGNFVFALANPFGFKTSVVSGIVTSLNVGFRKWGKEEFIATDARLNPGFSGGPLVDVSGRMIGLNTAYVMSRGISFPIKNVRNIVNGLLREGRIKRAYLGITSYTVELPQELATEAQINQKRGVIVVSVEANSAAKRAGLVLGDVIISFDGKPVADASDLPQLLTEESIGKESRISILRGEKPAELIIVPSERRREN